ncbi:MAG: ester cyclase [Actinocatenispora sp.]
MDDDTVRDLVCRFYERLWNAWDDDGVADVLAPDITFRGSLGQRTNGRDGWRAYRDRVRLGAPDFHNEILDVVATADRAAARLRYTGTHLGPFLDIPATGRRFGYSGAAFFTAAGGLLTDIWVLGDLQAVHEQLRGRRDRDGSDRDGSDHDGSDHDGSDHDGSDRDGGSVATNA